MLLKTLKKIKVKKITHIDRNFNTDAMYLKFLKGTKFLFNSSCDVTNEISIVIKDENIILITQNLDKVDVSVKVLSIHNGLFSSKYLYSSLDKLFVLDEDSLYELEKVDYEDELGNVFNIGYAVKTSV